MEKASHCNKSLCSIACSVVYLTTNSTCCCGLPQYDVDDWEKNTKYPGTVKHAATIRNFWKLIREFSNEQRAAVLRFVTGSAGVPVEGFKALRGRQARNAAVRQAAPGAA